MGIFDLVDVPSIFNNLIAGVISSLAVILSFTYYIRITKASSILQTHIYARPEYIICKKGKYSISQIPEVLTEYRKKLYSTDDKDELSFWSTRISTFIIFTDKERVLILDRNKNKQEQIVNNLKLDCYGAVAFHNPSLSFKLPDEFMGVTIETLEAIPGIALEKNSRKFMNFDIPFKREVAIMIGFVAYVNAENLEKGVDNKNKIVSLSCLSPDDTNLTAKTKLGIKHLQSISMDDFSGVG